MSSVNNQRQVSQRSASKNKPASKKKKTIITAVSVAVVVAVVIGVIAAVTVSNWDEYQQLSANRKTVATCNGYEIPYEELRFVTLFYKDTLADKYGADIWSDPAKAEEHRAELEAMVQEKLNENYVVLSACRDLHIPTEGKEIDEYVDDYVKQLRESCEADGQSYKEWLAELGMTENYMRFSIGVNYLESAVHYTLLDNDLYTFRYDNIADFKDYVENNANYVRTIHVFIDNEDGEAPAENLAKAQEISNALLDVSDFNERLSLMSEYIGSAVNDDLLSVSGDGYYFTRGEMVEEYENASFALEIGGVSEPVVCSGGNFVIMRLAPQRAYIDKHAETLLENYHGVALGLYIDQFRPACEVTFNEYGQSIDLVALQ